MCPESTGLRSVSTSHLAEGVDGPVNRDRTNQRKIKLGPAKTNEWKNQPGMDLDLDRHAVLPHGQAAGGAQLMRLQRPWGTRRRLRCQGLVAKSMFLFIAQIRRMLLASSFVFCRFGILIQLPVRGG